MRLALFPFLLVILPFQADADSCQGKTVSVFVGNANGLESKAGGAPNAYVEVEVDGNIKTTNIKIGQANPIFLWWLKFGPGNNEVMTLKIKDMGAGADELLGSCAIEVESRPRGSVKSFKRLVCSAENGGELSYTAKCT